MFKESDWDKYPLSTTAEHGIIEHIIVENPDFDHLAELSNQIEEQTLAFIQDIQDVFI